MSLKDDFLRQFARLYEDNYARNTFERWLSHYNRVASNPDLIRRIEALDDAAKKHPSYNHTISYLVKECIWPGDDDKNRRLFLYTNARRRTVNLLCLLAHHASTSSGLWARQVIGWVTQLEKLTFDDLSELSVKERYELQNRWGEITNELNEQFFTCEKALNANRAWKYLLAYVALSDEPDIARFGNVLFYDITYGDNKQIPNKNELREEFHKKARLMFPDYDKRVKMYSEQELPRSIIANAIPESEVTYYIEGWEDFLTDIDQEVERLKKIAEIIKKNPTDTANLLDEIRQYLDYIIWFTLEYNELDVKSSWFISLKPDGQEIASPISIHFMVTYRAPDPSVWTMKTIFDGGKKKSIPTVEYFALLGGQLRTLQDILYRRSDGISPFFPRSELYPKGDTIKEFYDDYIDVREKVVAYYFKFVKKFDFQPPFTGFPDPVPLPSEEHYDTVASAESKIVLRKRSLRNFFILWDVPGGTRGNQAAILYHKHGEEVRAERIGEVAHSGQGKRYRLFAIADRNGRFSIEDGKSGVSDVSRLRTSITEAIEKAGFELAENEVPISEGKKGKHEFYLKIKQWRPDFSEDFHQSIFNKDGEMMDFEAPATLELEDDAEDKQEND